jgi:hypothetical protein
MDCRKISTSGIPDPPAPDFFEYADREKSAGVSFFFLCLGVVPASFSCLLARITPDREFPAIFRRHPDVQLRLQLRMPAEQLLPVGDLASRDGFGISVEEILDGQPVPARPGGNAAAGF